MGKNSNLTPEQKKEQRRIYDKKRNERIKNDPVLKANRKEIKSRYEAKIPKEVRRAYNTNYQRKRRALLRQFQQKVSNKQSS